MTRWQMGVWYAGTLGAVAFMPFMGAVLEEAGWSAPSMVSVFVLGPIFSLLGGPAWSWLAERTGRPVLWLRIACVGLLLASFSLAWFRSYETVFLSMTAFSLFGSALTPIGTAVVVGALGKSSEYGSVRVWGSVAFLAVVVIGGGLRDIWAPAPFLMAQALLISVIVTLLYLPEPGSFIRARGDSAWRRVLSDPLLLLALLVGYLHGVGMASYDFMFSVHVERLELASGIAGAAFGVGVVAEIFMLRLGHTMLERFGTRTVLWIGLASGAPRWWLTGYVEEPVLLVLVQALHGLTFGAFWVAGVALFSEHLPQNVQSSAQALWSGAVFGAGVLSGLALSAYTVPETGTASGAFTASAGVSLAATLLGLGLFIRRRPR